MANKTIRGHVAKYNGTTVLYAKVFAENQSTAINGASGDAVTIGSDGVFAFTLTESAAGVYDVQLFRDVDDSEYTARDKVWIPGDIAGTYDVGSEVARAKFFANYQIYPSVERSITDDKAISFMFPLPSVTFSTKTVSIDGATASNVTGAITYEEQIGSYYRYELAFNAADRPTDEGTALYTFSDGTNTVYVTLRVTSAGLTDEQAAKIDLIGTGQALANSPVTADGYIEKIIRGDDYTAANGTAFEWNWTAKSGYVAGTSSCKFGGISACDSATVGWLITGTITNNAGIWTLSFDMGKAISAALADSKYDWSVEVSNAAGLEITVAKSRPSQPVNVYSKQT